ncbi:hypothetical protein [Bradyrhizobium sp. USDA 4529]
MAELRRKLTAFSAPERWEQELTIAVSAAPDKLVILEAADLARSAERIHLMVYDYHAGSVLLASMLRCPRPPITATHCVH